MSGRERPRLPLTLLGERFAVCRLDASAAIPPWALAPCALSSISRSADELSILIDEPLVPRDVRAERGYRALRVRGPLPFHLIGIFASMTQPLADAGLSIFALSTYDTDYVLVKEHDLAAAIEVLERAGHTIDRS